MRWCKKSLAGRVLEDTQGQVLFLVVLGITAFIGLAGLSLDLGNYYSAVQVLQVSTNVAALAGAAALPDSSSAAANVTLYSSMPGQLNANPRLQNVSITPSFQCLAGVTNMGIPCKPATGSYSGSVNALKVVQTATIPLWFGGIFGVPSWKAAATSTVSMNGFNTPTNVAIIMDATFSQNSTDDDCGSGVTEMQCELQGLQTMLLRLYPCKPSLATCTFTSGVAAQSVDRVAMFTFPGLSTTTASVDSNCTSTPTTTWEQNQNWMNGGGGVYWNAPYQNPNETAWPSWPNSVPYSFPTVGASSYSPSSYAFTAKGLSQVTATYEVTLGLSSGDPNGFFSDYRASDTATTLNTSSPLVNLAGGAGSCGGLATPNYDGVYGTYYAGVIYAAQAALTAELAANPGSENVIIILSDGNATAPQNHNGLYYQSGYSNYVLPVMPTSSSGTTANGLYATGSGTYPSYNGECGQSVVAAKYATSQGTTVFTIAYGSGTTSDSSNCSTDMNYGAYKRITPCQSMQDMASSISDFYTSNQAGASNTCKNAVVSSNNNSLNQIFANISAALSKPRLIPNGTQ
jgi:hypothetical protein